MRREITENSLARAPPDCCQCPLHVSPLLKQMDHICVPSCQEHCTWHSMCLPQIPSACRASCFQFGNTSHPEKSSSPACCDGIEQVNPFERVLGQLPSLPVGTPSKLDSSSSDSDCSLSYFEEGYQSSCMRPEQDWWMREKATCTTLVLLQSDLGLAVHSSSTEIHFPHVKWSGWEMKWFALLCSIWVPQEMTLG